MALAGAFVGAWVKTGLGIILQLSMSGFGKAKLASGHLRGIQTDAERVISTLKRLPLISLIGAGALAKFQFSIAKSEAPIERMERSLRAYGYSQEALNKIMEHGRELAKNPSIIFDYNEQFVKSFEELGGMIPDVNKLNDMYTILTKLGSLEAEPGITEDFKKLGMALWFGWGRHEKDLNKWFDRWKDVWAQAKETSSATGTEMAQAIGVVGPIASGAGMSEAQVIAEIAGVVSFGYKGSAMSAGQGMRVYLGMISKAQERLGIELTWTKQHLREQKIAEKRWKRFEGKPLPALMVADILSKKYGTDVSKLLGEEGQDVEERIELTAEAIRKALKEPLGERGGTRFMAAAIAGQSIIKKILEPRKTGLLEEQLRLINEDALSKKLMDIKNQWVWARRAYRVTLGESMTWELDMIERLGKWFEKMAITHRGLIGGIGKEGILGLGTFGIVGLSALALNKFAQGWNLIGNAILGAATAMGRFGMLARAGLIGFIGSLPVAIYLTSMLIDLAERAFKQIAPNVAELVDAADYSSKMVSGFAEKGVTVEPSAAKYLDNLFAYKKVVPYFGAPMGILHDVSMAASFAEKYAGLTTYSPPVAAGRESEPVTVHQSISINIPAATGTTPYKLATFISNFLRDEAKKGSEAAVTPMPTLSRRPLPVM